VAALGSVLIAGCRTGPSAGGRLQGSEAEGAGGDEPAADDATQTDQIEAHAHYSAGIIHELDDEPELALHEYYLAALKDPGNETLIMDVTRQFIQANQLDKALELLTRATARPNASGEIYARLGYVYSRQGKTEQAIKADRNAIKYRSDLLVGYRNLVLTYLEIKQPKTAWEVLNQASVAPHPDADFLLGLAELYATFGLHIPGQKAEAYARSFDLLQRVKQLGVDDPQMQLRMADGYNALGKYEAAAQIYMDLLKRLPDMPYVRESIRAKLKDMSQHDRDPKLATEQLEAVIRDNPTDVRAYYLLGGIAYDAKKYSDAADYYTRAMLLDPEFEPVYYDLAGVQLGDDKPRQSLETLDRARQKFPQNFLLEYLYGITYTRLKDYTNAVNHFNAADILAPAKDTNRMTDFYFQFAAACERKGDYAAAEKYFEKCLQLSPDSDEALNYLGFMWADRGEKLDRARELIERAVKNEPDNPAYLDSMGWVLFKLHQPAAALDWILKAIKSSEEEDSTIYDHLGDIYAALGQMDKARQAWSKSLKLEPNEAVRKKLGPGAAP
jgi:tetratricopeptide (TPR) repeat protein